MSLIEYLTPYIISVSVDNSAPSASSSSSSNTSVKSSPDVPIIVWWTGFTHDPGTVETCGDVSCFFTVNRSYRDDPRTKVSKTTPHVLIQVSETTPLVRTKIRETSPPVLTNVSETMSCVLTKDNETTPCPYQDQWNHAPLSIPRSVEPHPLFVPMSVKPRPSVHNKVSETTPPVHTKVTEINRPAPPCLYPASLCVVSRAGLLELTHLTHVEQSPGLGHLTAGGCRYYATAGGCIFQLLVCDCRWPQLRTACAIQIPVYNICTCHSFAGDCRCHVFAGVFVLWDGHRVTWSPVTKVATPSVGSHARGVTEKQLGVLKRANDESV